MSRIGKKPIKLELGVTLETQGDVVVVNGQKGKLSMNLPKGIRVRQNDGMIIVERDESASSANFGRVRAQLANMIQGVSEGWKKTLEIIGTGYRATTDGKLLTLSVGFSHPVVVKAPEGVEFQVVQNKITLLGADKQVVGEIAAHIRKIRPPDSYKGKGMRYEGEYIRRKPGKAAKGATGAGGNA